MGLLRAESGTTFLCGTCLDGAPWASRYMVGYPGFDGVCDWCSSLAQNLVEAAVNEPQIGEWGPFDFSTSLELAPVITIVWDVNCYYRDLGVPTDATRRQIREAYQAAEGWNDDRLTHIVKVLLNDEKRAVYDSAQPGAFYFDKFLRRVTEQAVSDSDAWEYDENVNPEDSLKAELDEKMDTVVNVHNPNHHTSIDDDLVSEQTALDRSSWGWYRWRSSCRTPHVLSRWRCELALALRNEGVVTTLRVGLAGALDEPWSVEPIGHRPVAFLRDGEEPTREHAEEAALTIIRRFRPTSC